MENLINMENIEDFLINEIFFEDDFSDDDGEEEEFIRFFLHNLQGVCDHTGKFIDCLIGRPGRAHDAAVFRSSNIYGRLIDEANPLLPSQRHIIGDSAYPLLKNVMTPFRDNGNLTPEKSMYNTTLSSIRSIIERAYGLLKGKWRRLKYLDVKSIDMANHIIAAACTLHNFLILHNEIAIRENVNIDININIEHEDYNSDENDNDFQNENGQMKRQEIANRLLQLKRQEIANRLL